MSGRPPRVVTGASLLVAVEGAVAAAYGLYLAVRALVDDPLESVLGVEVGALFALLLGLGLLLAARAVLRLRARARGPVVTVQLLLLATALSSLRGAGAGSALAAVLGAGLAAGVLALLFAAPARAAFDAADRA